MEAFEYINNFDFILILFSMNFRLFTSEKLWHCVCLNTSFTRRKHGIYGSQMRHLRGVNTAFTKRRLPSLAMMDSEPPDSQEDKQMKSERSLRF